MRVIFLDVDGVLNCEKYVIKQAHKYAYPWSNNGHLQYFCEEVPFTPVAFDTLHRMRSKDLFDTIVLHSSWRLNEKAEYMLNARLENIGLKIFDRTNTGRKAESIIQYLEEHKDQIDQWFILEDEWQVIKDNEELTNMLKEHTLKVNPVRGLRFAHVNEFQGLVNKLYPKEEE